MKTTPKARGGKGMRYTNEPGDTPRERRDLEGVARGAATTNADTRHERRLLLLLVLVFVLLAAGITTVGYLSYRGYAAHYRAQVGSQLSAVAELKVADLVLWRQERLRDAHLVFENAAFSHLVARLLSDPDDVAARGRAQAWMARYLRPSEYEEVRLLDAQGATRLSAPANPGPVPAAVRERIAQVVESRQVAMTDIFRKDDDGRPSLATLVPILHERDARRVIGILALQADPHQHLYPFIRRWPTASRTAETLLVRRDGSDVLFLNELRFRKDAALALRIPLARTDVLAVKAVQGQSGVVEGVDYRGVKVIGSVHPVPGSPWFLVARMDAAEAFAPLRTRRVDLAAVVGALLLAAAAGVGIVWRQQRARVYRERFEAAEALYESEIRYRLLFQNLAAGFALLEVVPGEDGRPGDYRFLEVNPAFEALTGLKAADLVGRTVGEVRPGIDADWLAAYGRVAATGDSVTFESHRAPLRRHHQVTAYAPAPGRLATILQDITARTQAQDALRESSDRLRRAEAIGHLGHWSLDLLAQRISWSDEVFRIHGVPVAEGDLAPDAWASCVLPEDRAQHAEAIAAIQRHGTGAFEYRVRRPDGAVRHVSARGELRRDPAGHPVSLFGTVLDATDLRQKERELRERNDELARFAYTVSHDLKSPLVTIKSFLGYLEEDTRRRDAPGIEKDLAFIRGAVDKMAQLLDELLELSRVGHKKNRFVETSLQALVQDAQALVAGRIADRGVQVRVTSEPVLLYGDRSRLVEVFQNLLDNAVKFMGDQPAPCVEIGVRPEGADTVVFVRDNGIGVDRRHQHRLFGLFEQLDPAVEGTGMGLALARRIVEVHGGRIRVESDGAGTGATFSFTLANTRRPPREEQTP